MASVEVVPLTHEILLRLEPRNSLVAPSVGAYWERWLLSASRFSAAAVEKDSGHPVGAIGLVSPWNGVGEIWAVADRRIGRHPVEITKAVGRFLDTAERLLKLRWMTALVSAEDERALRYAEYFGFRRQQFMDDYGPNGEAFWLVVRRRKW